MCRLDGRRPYARIRAVASTHSCARVAGSTCPTLTSGPLSEQVLAASTAQRLEVEEELRASAEELVRVSTELHGAREQLTELSTVRAELEAASEAEAQRRSELEACTFWGALARGLANTIVLNERRGLNAEGTTAPGYGSGSGYVTDGSCALTSIFAGSPWTVTTSSRRCPPP